MPPKPVVVNYADDYEDDWLFYAKSGITSFYFNPAKMTRINSVFKVWTETRDNTDDVVMGKSLLEINCATQKIRSVAGVRYYEILSYADGKESKVKSLSSYDTTDAKFEVIFPDSAGEVISDKLCKAIR